MMELLKSELDAAFAHREKWSARLQQEMDEAVRMVAQHVREDAPTVETDSGWRLEPRYTGHPQGAPGPYDGWTMWIRLVGGNNIIAATEYGYVCDRLVSSCEKITATRSQRLEAAKALPKLILAFIEALKRQGDEAKAVGEELAARIVIN